MDILEITAGILNENRCHSAILIKDISQIVMRYTRCVILQRISFGSTCVFKQVLFTFYLPQILLFYSMSLKQNRCLQTRTSGTYLNRTLQKQVSLSIMIPKITLRL